MSLSTASDEELIAEITRRGKNPALQVPALADLPRTVGPRRLHLALPWMSQGHREMRLPMICPACKDVPHDTQPTTCKGPGWCDCQHRPQPRKATK